MDSPPIPLLLKLWSKPNKCCSDPRLFSKPSADFPPELAVIRFNLSYSNTNQRRNCHIWKFCIDRDTISKYYRMATINISRVTLIQWTLRNVFHLPFSMNPTKLRAALHGSPRVGPLHPCTASSLPCTATDPPQRLQANNGLIGGGLNQS